MEHLISWLDKERGRRLGLARGLGIGPSAVSQWRQVPAERVLDVERLTGISRHDLRADLYGPAHVADGRASTLEASA